MTIEELGDAERIALVYAPHHLRKAFRLILALDSQLARIALGAREPALAQLKLAWWRDACRDGASIAGHPLTGQLAQRFPGQGGVMCALIDAWEEIAAGGGSFADSAGIVAQARAAVLALAAGLAPDEACRAAAQRWTLTALAGFAPEPEQRKAMLDCARSIPPVQLPRAQRPLAVLDGLAQRMLKTGGGALLGDRFSPFAALRLGILGR